jgi:hypothetical protein
MPLLPSTVTAGMSGHIAHSGQAYSKLNDWPNVVRDYNANNAGTADASSAWQTAINDLPNPGVGQGGAIVVPVGAYRFDSTVVHETGVPISIIVAGGGGLSETSNYDGRGAVVFPNTNGQTLFDFDSSGGAIHQFGHSIHGLTLSASRQAGDATGTIGIRARNLNRLQFTRCGFNKLSTGIYLDSAIDLSGSNDSAWHDFWGLHFSGCTTAIYSRHCYGFVMHGGSILNAAAGTGILLDNLGNTVSTQHVRITGVKFDGGAIGIDCRGGCNHFTDCIFENSTLGIKVWDGGSSAPLSGERNNIIGCNFSGSGTEKGFDILSSADRTKVVAPQFVNLGSPKYTNSGTNTDLIAVEAA